MHGRLLENALVFEIVPYIFREFTRHDGYTPQGGSLFHQCSEKFPVRHICRSVGLVPG
jgi:hypothetical protein